MRIVHVTQPVEAGVAVVVASLARHQAAEGHAVSIICPEAGQRSGPLAELANLPAVRMLIWNASREPGPAVFAETADLRAALAGTGADVIVLHAAKAGLAGRLAARGRVRTVFVPHAWSFEAVEGATRAAAVRWERWAQRWTDVTVCVSEGELRQGQNAGVDADAVVIPNGVDVNRFVPGSSLDARARLGLVEAPTLVCVGRLTRQKGQDRLLAAWPAVRRRCRDAQLVLVGDGPDRAALEARTQPGVHFVGATEDARPYLLAADLVAVTSRWEAGALVPMEAMASGRSVVSVDVTGMRETLGSTGTIVAGGDDAASIATLADALASRLSDEPGTAELGHAARRHAVDTFSLGASLAQWRRLLTPELVAA